MKQFLRISDESGDEVRIGVAQISTVRYANYKRRGEMVIIRMSDGQVFEVKADLFDAELDGLEDKAPEPLVVAAAPPPPAKVEEPAKAVEVVKKRVTKSR